MAPEVTTKQSKLRWAEMEDDDDDDLAYLLPPKEIIGPDKNGIKKVIEYKFNEEGQKVKVTTTSRIKKVAVNSRRMERIMERRSNWAKFGDAVGDDDNDTRLTMVSTEDIFLERPKSQGSKVEEPKANGDPFAQQGKAGGALLMLCRTCGKKGDHWTARCPYKDLAPPPSSENGIVDKYSASETVGSGKTKYVPPSKRAGAERSGTDMRRNWDDENSVRVNNLSEDTREPDLRELFEAFGRVSRVHVGIDRETGMCRGFGFVNFVEREDAEKAIKKLNGYGYDNLILKVEWANARPN